MAGGQTLFASQGLAEYVNGRFPHVHSKNLTGVVKAVSSAAMFGCSSLALRSKVQGLHRSAGPRQCRETDRRALPKMESFSAIQTRPKVVGGPGG